MERKIQGMARLISVVILCGLLHGTSSACWHFSTDSVGEASSFLKDVSMQLGSRSEMDQPLAETHEEQFTRHGVVSWMVCRQADPMKVHIPDISCKNAGFHQEKTQHQREELTKQGYLANYMTSRFTETIPSNTPKLHFDWYRGGLDRRQEVSNARFHFTHKPYLFKHNVVRLCLLGATHGKSGSDFFCDSLPMHSASISPLLSWGSVHRPTSVSLVPGVVALFERESL